MSIEMVASDVSKVSKDAKRLRPCLLGNTPGDRAGKWGQKNYIPQTLYMTRLLQYIDNLTFLWFWCFLWLGLRAGKNTHTRRFYGQVLSRSHHFSCQDGTRLRKPQDPPESDISGMSGDIICLGMVARLFRNWPFLVGFGLKIPRCKSRVNS